MNAKAPEVSLPQDLIELEDLRYKNIVVEGEYLTKYTILLDNQVEGEVAGYHVITPLRLTDREAVLLIDRGWIPALPNHNDVPQVETPDGLQKVEGQVWLPSQKFFSLQPQEMTNNDWQPVWQNLDMKAYANAVPFKVLPVALRMSPKNAGGFVRNWVRPDDRIETHLSYAYQWFGFAFAALAIYLFVSFRRCSQSRQ